MEIAVVIVVIIIVVVVLLPVYWHDDDYRSNEYPFRWLLHIQHNIISCHRHCACLLLAAAVVVVAEVVGAVLRYFRLLSLLSYDVSCDVSPCRGLYVCVCESVCHFGAIPLSSRGGNDLHPPK